MKFGLILLLSMAMMVWVVAPTCSAETLLSTRYDDQYDFRVEEETFIEAKVAETSSTFDTIQTSHAIRKSGRWISVATISIAFVAALFFVAVCTVLAVAGIPKPALNWSFLALFGVLALLNLGEVLTVFLRR